MSLSDHGIAEGNDTDDYFGTDEEDRKYSRKSMIWNAVVLGDDAAGRGLSDQSSWSDSYEPVWTNGIVLAPGFDMSDINNDDAPRSSTSSWQPKDSASGVSSLDDMEKKRGGKVSNRMDSSKGTTPSGFNSSAMDASSAVEVKKADPRKYSEDEELQKLLAMEPKRVSSGTGNLSRKL